MTKRRSKNNQDRWLRLYKIIGLVFCVYFLLLTVEAVFFENRFGAGTMIAGADVSWQNKTEAVSKLKKVGDNYQKSFILINQKQYLVSDLIQKIDPDKSVENALARQRSQYLTLEVFTGSDNSAAVATKDAKITQLLSQEYNTASIIPGNAQIKIDGRAKIILEKEGRRLMLPESREAIIKGLSSFAGQIQLKEKSMSVALTSKEAESLLSSVEEMTKDPVNLISDRGNLTITSTQLKSWIKVQPQTPKTLILAETIIPREEKEKYYFFDESKIRVWLRGIANKINQKASNAQLGFQNNQVVVLESSTTGYWLDEADAVAKIQNVTTDNRSVNLKIDVTRPEVRADNLETLGLKELVSTGWTNFTGSPSNRLHNIRNGASKFNGALIRPGENFSFNKTLGPVEASTGYLPELVILQNKTTPQYGGGLCQVSSTAFRAALNAGLPILERTKHAYPVTYYKPYGVDATVYLPKPDLVFTNDTGNYILIQTRIAGTKLFFDFYGTKPARTVKFAGNANGAGAVDLAENITPNIYDQGARGSGSFTAAFSRFIYDSAGKLIRTNTFTSKYDSPAKYPH